jgi:hypothetical protein
VRAPRPQRAKTADRGVLGAHGRAKGARWSGRHLAIQTIRQADVGRGTSEQRLAGVGALDGHGQDLAVSYPLRWLLGIGND